MFLTKVENVSIHMWVWGTKREDIMQRMLGMLYKLKVGDLQPKTQ